MSDAEIEEYVSFERDAKAAAVEHTTARAIAREMDRLPPDDKGAVTVWMDHAIKRYPRTKAANDAWIRSRGDAPPMLVANAMRELEMALVEDRLECQALRDGSSVSISKGEWLRLEIAYGSNAARDRLGHESFDDLTFLRSAVIQLWPEQSEVTGASADDMMVATASIASTPLQPQTAQPLAYPEEPPGEMLGSPDRYTDWQIVKKMREMILAGRAKSAHEAVRLAAGKEVLPKGLREDPEPSEDARRRRAYGKTNWFAMDGQPTYPSRNARTKAPPNQPRLITSPKHRPNIARTTPA